MTRHRARPAGPLLAGLAAVLAALGLAAGINGDAISGVVFGLLAVTAGAAMVSLRQRGSRVLRGDLTLVGWIFAIFALVFALERDWRAVAAASLVIGIVWLASMRLTR